MSALAPRIKRQKMQTDTTDFAINLLAASTEEIVSISRSMAGILCLLIDDVIIGRITPNDAIDRVRTLYSDINAAVGQSSNSGMFIPMLNFCKATEDLLRLKTN